MHRRFVALRPRAPQFEFHQVHSLYGAAHQVLRSKQACVMHVGAPPPREPKQLGAQRGVTQAWLDRRTKFAAFMVANFVPWELDDEEGSKPPPLESATLTAWQDHLQAHAHSGANSRRRCIARGRLFAIKQYVHALSMDLHTKQVGGERQEARSGVAGGGVVGSRCLSVAWAVLCVQVLTQYRSRNRQMWKKKEDDEDEKQKSRTQKQREGERSEEEIMDEMNETRRANASHQLDVERAQQHGEQEELVASVLGSLGIEPLPALDTCGADTAGVRTGRSSELLGECVLDVSAAAAKRAIEQRGQKEVCEGAAETEGTATREAPTAAAAPSIDVGEATAAFELDEDKVHAQTLLWEEAKREAERQGQRPPRPPLSMEQRTVGSHPLRTLLEIAKAKARCGGGGASRKHYMSEWLSAAKCKEYPLQFLLTGPAGAGKTEVINKLEQVMESLGIGTMLLSAFTGARKHNTPNTRNTTGDGAHGVRSQGPQQRS